MHTLPRWRRSVAALVVAAAFVPIASTPATAGAAPKRTADTTTYTSASYLREVLDLPVKPKLVIESVTYDRFQWLLQQEGQFAFLIGDPATDQTFASRAQAVEEIAETSGVKRVYWFDPNLSGNATIGTITEPNLDIRNPAGITKIGATNQAIYGRAWHNLIGRYLGNGVAVTQGGAANTGSASLTTAVGTLAANGVLNDYGSTPGFSTRVGSNGVSDPNGGALYDYTGGVTPANVQDSYFFLYNKDATVTAADTSLKPAKIVGWTNLTKQPDEVSAKAAIAAVIAKCGASTIKDVDEYSWWKSSTNKWQTTSSPNAYQGAEVPVITDADGDAANGGWRVHQITYPELVYLLKTETAKDVVLLFGGNWCPNTRPVIPFINRYAQQNNVTVFNFDTILDGSIVGGGNASSNPLQVRGPAQSGLTANPSFIYGDLVTQYLSNLKTEYLPTASNRITYYPGGDTTLPQTSQPRLQVPYLFGYKGQPESESVRTGGINRQWIFDKGNGTYTEYMSSWHWTNPQANQLGVSTTNALRQTPAWTTINDQLATFTWQTDPETLKANTATDSDAAQFLTNTDKATVGGLPNVTVASSTAAGAIDVNPTALSAALTALGASAPANYAAARTALITELGAAVAGPNRENLRTVVGAWGVSQSRKNTVNGIWGSAGSPGSVAGGLAAVHAAEAFFDGLATRPEPAAPAQEPAKTTTSTSTTTSTATKPVTTTVPVVTTPFSANQTSKVSKVTGAVAKTPTRAKSGRYRVVVATPKGLAKATGKVTVKLRKGKATKTVVGTLSGGAVTVTVPKLARGTWKVTILWPGDASYLGVAATGAAIKVTR